MSDSPNALQQLLESAELYRFAEIGIRFQQQKNLDQLEKYKDQYNQLELLKEYRQTRSKEVLEELNQVQQLNQIEKDTLDYLDSLRKKFYRETLENLNSIYQQHPLSVKQDVRKLDPEQLCQNYTIQQNRLCETGNVQLLKEFTRHLTKPKN